MKYWNVDTQEEFTLEDMRQLWQEQTESGITPRITFDQFMESALSKQYGIYEPIFEPGDIGT